MGSVARLVGNGVGEDIDALDAFIQNIARTVPVIRVDYERYRDAEEMAAVIEREYLDSSFIRDAGWEPTGG